MNNENENKEFEQFRSRNYNHEYSPWEVDDGHELGYVLHDPERNLTIFLQEIDYYGAYGWIGTPDDHDYARQTEFVERSDHDSWDSVIEKVIEKIDDLSMSQEDFDKIVVEIEKANDLEGYGQNFEIENFRSNLHLEILKGEILDALKTKKEAMNEGE